VGISGALVLVVGGAGIVGGRITPGQLLSLYAGFSLLRNQWLAVSRAVPRIITGVESLVALCEILRVSDPPPYHGAERLSFAGSVTLEGVFFRYTDGLILKGADIHIERGAHVALVGENGAGKSTVISLILGLYRPERGRVLVDGRELGDLDLPHLRRQIGVTPQDPIIVPGTIADNIAYGAPEVGEREIARAARLSGAHEFIMSLPRGYETQVGEDGMLLSGGQRQRIALARALVRRPRLLILDEPTNHLEAASFDALVRNLRELDERPTMLVISHSKDVVRSAEFVYALHEGCITASRARGLASAKELPVG
jgi:ABC-type bacteriocin/lantibiotic exporter with double-glycine peptidase domain